MNIMEKNLPVAESLGSGDKVRIVTSGGNSKQIDASLVNKIQRIITITTEDIITCADENNIVNEWDLLEYTIKKHIGIIPKGNGAYFIVYDFFFTDNSYNGILRYSFPLSIVTVYFMGADTSAAMGINSIYTFDGAVDYISKGTELPQSYPKVTINGTTYNIIPINGTKRRFETIEE